MPLIVWPWPLNTPENGLTSVLYEGVPVALPAPIGVHSVSPERSMSLSSTTSPEAFSQRLVLPPALTALAKATRSAPVAMPGSAGVSGMTGDWRTPSVTVTP